MTNKELAKWQKEQAAELGEMEESDEENDEEEAPSVQAKPEDNGEDTKEEKESVEIKHPSEMTLEDLRKVIEILDPYYKPYPGSDNPYRDGYYTEVS
eukprot:scaffold52694_cov43-Cyclotella_meneghiniana.AAC.2